MNEKCEHEQDGRRTAANADGDTQGAKKWAESSERQYCAYSEKKPLAEVIISFSEIYLRVALKFSNERAGQEIVPSIFFLGARVN